MADAIDYMLKAEIKTPVRFMKQWVSKTKIRLKI
jgi:hypothetical protein